MHERAGTYHSLARGAAIAASLLLLGGSVNPVTAERSAIAAFSERPLPGCGDPPPAMIPPADAYAREPQIMMQLSPDGSLKDDPGPLNNADQRAVENALVRIVAFMPDANEAEIGNGVIIRNTPEETTVLTVAHIGEGVPRGNITVYAKDDSAEVIDGCRQHVYYGREEDAVIDLAILVVRHIGNGALVLASVPPQRGDRNITYASYQPTRTNYMARTVASYNAVMVHPSASGFNDKYLNGIGDKRDCSVYMGGKVAESYPLLGAVNSDCASIPGTSGSPVLRRTGNGKPEVLGIHIYTERNANVPWITNGSLEANYGVYLNVSSETGGVWPQVGVAVNAASAQRALYQFDHRS